MNEDNSNFGSKEAWYELAVERMKRIRELEHKLGRAFMMCRELMAEDAYKMFRDALDRAAVAEGLTASESDNSEKKE